MKNKILLCSFSFGYGIGAEGICTYRLACALAKSGIELTVITSNLSKTKPYLDNINIYKIDSWPFKLHKLLSIYNRIFRKNADPFNAWKKKVAHIKIPNKVDCIYARSSPFASIDAAYELAIKNRLSLIVHFSDPIPSPWADKNSNQYNLLLNRLKLILDYAYKITFTNHEAMLYQEKLVGNIIRKSFVLNHVAPNPIFLAKAKHEKVTFLYTGTFYGKRSFDDLLLAIKRYSSFDDNFEFHFVGSGSFSLYLAIVRYKLGNFCKVYPKTSHLEKYYRDSDVLVATDPKEGDQVFLSTKLVEYALLDRPILLISPKNSPGSHLVARFPETSLRVDYDPDAISSAMLQMSKNRSYSKTLYQSRFISMTDFLEKEVAKTFIKNVCSSYILLD